MQAILLGAGFGTRLQPITQTIPKVLLPVLDRPLLLHLIQYLTSQNVKPIALNLHHLAGAVNTCLKERYTGRAEISINFEEEILGTGGGIKGLQPSIGADDFLVYNGDIITDIDLTKAFAFHTEHQGLATLVLHDYPGLNMVYVGKEDRIVDIRNQAGHGSRAIRMLAFTGVSILNKRIFDLLPDSGYADIIALYLKLLAAGEEKIMGYAVSGHYWRDIGSPASYWQLHRELLLDNMTMPGSGARPVGPGYTHPEADVSGDCLFNGFSALYEGCQVKNATLDNCIVLPGTTLLGPVRHKDIIIGPDYTIVAGEPE